MISKKVNEKLLGQIKKKYPNFEKEKWKFIEDSDWKYRGVIGYVYTDLINNSKVKKLIRFDFDGDLEDDEDGNDYEDIIISDLPINKVTDILDDIDKYYNNDPNIMLYMGSDNGYIYNKTHINKCFDVEGKVKYVDIGRINVHKFKNQKIFFDNNRGMKVDHICSISGYDIYNIIVDVYNDCTPINIICKNNIIVTAVKSWSCVHNGDGGMSFYKYNDEKLFCYGNGDDTSLMVIDFNFGDSPLMTHEIKKKSNKDPDDSSDSNEE